MGVWASHFISIDTTQYLKNIPLILEFLIKRFFLVMPILIFFKDIYKKNFFILFYFLYNFYNLLFLYRLQKNIDFESMQYLIVTGLFFSK